MGSGPKTTTTSTNTQNTNQTNQSNNQSSSQGSNSQQNTGQSNNQFSNTSTPNLPDWFNQLKQSVAQQYGQMYNQYGQMANHPLFGQQQQANFQEGLNRNMGQAQQQLMSSLASRGALNSGNAAQAQTGMALGGAQQMQNYLAQIPLLNRQAQQQGMAGQMSALQGAGGMTIPYGTTQTGNSSSDFFNNLLSQFGQTGNSSGTSNQQGSSNSNGQQTQQQSGGLLQGLLGGLLNSGLGALTGGLSSLFTGGGGGAPSSSTMNNLPQTGGLNQTYGNPSSGFNPLNPFYGMGGYNPYDSPYGGG